jgi:hypothetical protein
MHPPAADGAADAAVPATSTCCGPAVNFRHLGDFSPTHHGWVFYCQPSAPAFGEGATHIPIRVIGMAWKQIPLAHQNVTKAFIIIYCQLLDY